MSNPAERNDWLELKRLFEQVVELSSDGQQRFLKEIPSALRARVEALLGADEQADSVFDKPVIAVAALGNFPQDPGELETLVSTARCESLVGQQFGHYQLEGVLGRGGMGVVYRAMDTQLERPVAVKILRPEWIGHADGRRRFHREAKTASLLNHPNIVTIHNMGQCQVFGSELDFLVMEYVEGQTLRQMLAARRLSEDEVRQYAIQIADAIQAAHQAGILHRDLKPANVMVTEKRVAKVLDFGLAKSWQQRDQTSLTGEAIVGTTAYMSPEQANGRELDPRSDIFAFGAMLYEMLTGRLAFPGESSASIVAAILRDQPEPVPGISAEMRKVLWRCLEKDPDARFPSAADLKLSLEECGNGEKRGSSKLRPLDRWMRRLGAAAAVVAVLFAGWVFWAGSGKSVRDWKPVSISSYAGTQIFPSLSPDGNSLAFMWNGERQDNTDIYVRRIGPGNPFRLTRDPAADRNPVWSPDGKWIVFERVGEKGFAAILLVPDFGGVERKIFEIYLPEFSGTIPKATLCWTGDGKYLIVAGRKSVEAPSRLYAVSVEDGSSRPLTTPPNGWLGDGDPALSPDGRMIAWTRTKSFGISEVYAARVADHLASVEEPRPFTSDQMEAAGVAWLPNGQGIVFSSNRAGRRTLWRFPVPDGSLSSFFQRHKPEELLQLGEDTLTPTISAAGRRLAYSTVTVITQVGRITLPPEGAKRAIAIEEEDAFITSAGSELHPQYSPDGKRIAFTSTRSGSAQIWVSDADGLNATQLTALPNGSAGGERWSPDGRKLAFGARMAGRAGVYVVDADGGPPKPLVVQSAPSQVPNWSSDGRYIYFASPRNGVSQIWRIPVSGGKAVQITRHGGFAAIESADGRYLYYAKDRGLRSPIWRVPVNGGEEVQVLEPLAQSRNFTLSREGIYYISQSGSATYGDFIFDNKPSTIRFLDFTTGAAETVAQVRKQVSFGLSVSPDGRHLLFGVVGHTRSEIRVVDGIW